MFLKQKKSLDGMHHSQSFELFERTYLINIQQQRERVGKKKVKKAHIEFMFLRLTAESAAKVDKIHRTKPTTKASF